MYASTDSRPTRFIRMSVAELSLMEIMRLHSASIDTLAGWLARGVAFAGSLSPK